jgi:hypothetical protein
MTFMPPPTKASRRTGSEPSNDQNIRENSWLAGFFPTARPIREAASGPQNRGRPQFDATSERLAGHQTETLVIPIIPHSWLVLMVSPGRLDWARGRFSKEARFVEQARYWQSRLHSDLDSSDASRSRRGGRNGCRGRQLGRGAGFHPEGGLTSRRLLARSIISPRPIRRPRRRSPRGWRN